MTGSVARRRAGHFVDTIATFGEVDHHFLRDIATAYLAMGAALALVVGRPPVVARPGALRRRSSQYALHTINHLFDIGGTDPAWQGQFNFISLLLLTVLLGWLLAGAARARAGMRIFVAGATGVIGRRLRADAGRRRDTT